MFLGFYCRPGQRVIFFFFKDLQSRQSHSKQRAGVIFIVIGIGLELKSGLSPSLRSHCGIYSNHSCLPTTQLNGTPKKYLSREDHNIFFKFSLFFILQLEIFILRKKKIIKLTQLLPLFIFQ